MPNGNEFGLYQTPTWLTWLSLYKHNGKKRKWKDTRYIYCEWLKSTLPTVVTDKEMEFYTTRRDEVMEHCSDIMSQKKLKFYTI